jgi:hypothetical protein
MNSRKFFFLKKRDTKQRQGLLRTADGDPVVDDNGRVVVARKPIRGRASLLRRMREVGYGR